LSQQNLTSLAVWKWRLMRWTCRQITFTC